MDDIPEISPPRLYIPQEGESIEDYLRRYTDEKLKDILRDQTLSVELGRRLLELSENTQEQPAQLTGLEALWKEMKEMKNYGRLKQFVQELRYVRERLLKDLEYYATYIENCTKIFSGVRLVSSVGDIAGSVGGILMNGSSHSNMLFTAATVLGATGCFSTITQTYIITTVCEDTQQQIERYQKLYGRVEKWFDQTQKLKQALLNVFPFDDATDILQEFSEAVNSEIQEAHLLTTFLRIVVERGISKIRIPDFLMSVLYFFFTPDIKDRCKLVNFKLSPARIEIGKMMLQLTTIPAKHQGILFHHLPRLSRGEQTISSPYVLGRITFNFLSALYAFHTLKTSEISNLAYEMRILRKRLKDQLEKLDEITTYFESKT